MPSQILYLLHFFLKLPPYLAIESLIPEWTGLLIAITAMVQIGIAMMMDARYDHRIWQSYVFTIWYPIAFWMLSMLTTVVAFPRALLRKDQDRGLWDSPDRGLQ